MFLQRELRWRLEHTRSGTHSIWISEQLQELGHEVVVANVRELRAISHSESIEMSRWMPN